MSDPQVEEPKILPAPGKAPKQGKPKRDHKGERARRAAERAARANGVDHELDDDDQEDEKPFDPRLPRPAAQHMAKMIAEQISLPYTAWARMSEDERLALMPEEIRNLEISWEEFLHLYGGYVVQWFVIVGVLMATGAPLASRLMLPPKPRGFTVHDGGAADAATGFVQP
jgi:hypothetical protein